MISLLRTDYLRLVTAAAQWCAAHQPELSRAELLRIHAFCRAADGVKKMPAGRKCTIKATDHAWLVDLAARSQSPSPDRHGNAPGVVTQKPPAVSQPDSQVNYVSFNPEPTATE